MKEVETNLNTNVKADKTKDLPGRDLYEASEFFFFVLF